MNTPQAPDPWATAQAQGMFNTQAAQTQNKLNNVNQITPYGSVNYTYGKGDGRNPGQATATTTLSPEMQALVDSNIKNAQGSSGLEGTLHELNKHTLDPQWDDAWAQKEQELYNRGVTPGSQAYDAAFRDFNNAKSQAYNQMYLQGHNTATGDIQAEYNSPLNALASLRSGSQVSQPGVGALAPTAQAGVQPVNYAGLESEAYKNQLAQSNAAMGGMFGLGGSALGAAAQFAPLLLSDRTMKTDIEELGTDPQTGLDMYAYRYKDDPKSYPKVVGPMAQDIEKSNPGMVRKIGGKRVINFGIGG